LHADLEQELRLNGNLANFNRSLTSASLDYTIIKKILKAGIDYDFIYQHNPGKNFYETRQRASVSLSGQTKVDPFDFTIKTRLQSIYRDETHGDYKFNPEYRWRNKLECEYTIFGSPVKPYLSGEIFCPINGKHGFFLDGYRACLGAKYRLSAQTSLNFQLRYDQEVQQANPKGTLYGCIGWNYRL
ncbi:MAG TPA: DUF2490 domain-containing protein, partial [Paludibacter sp.]|nr:DUF2490 domain-containing protein [Paludibacter sp.]